RGGKARPRNPNPPPLWAAAAHPLCRARPPPIPAGAPMTRRRLTLNSAMDLLRRHGARMIQTNTRTQVEHWITPSSVYVDPVLAAAIKAHPQVRAGRDSLFPGMDQMWRGVALPAPHPNSNAHSTSAPHPTAPP